MGNSGGRSAAMLYQARGMRSWGRLYWMVSMPEILPATDRTDLCAWEQVDKEGTRIPGSEQANRSLPVADDLFRASVGAQVEGMRVSHAARLLLGGLAAGPALAVEQNHF